jgi:hypothetical protein
MKSKSHSGLFLLIFLIGSISCTEKPGEQKEPQAHGLYAVKENSRFGYMDGTGKVVVPPSFDYAWDFKDGMGRFKHNGKYGFLNERGEIAIKNEFAYADDFKDGFARVNTKDTTMLDLHYDGYSLQSEWTFVDKSGLVFSERFAQAEYLKDGFAQVKDNPSYDTPWSYITLKAGQLTREDHNTEAIFSYNGHDTAPASDPSTLKIGTINKKEEWVIQPSFDAMEPYSEGLAAAKKGNQFGYIDQTGKWVYQQITSIHDNYFLNADFKPFSNGMAVVRTGKDSYAYVKSNGEIAFKQKFKSAGQFNPEGYAVVGTESGTGLIDKEGNFVVKPNVDIVAIEKGILIFKANSRVGAKNLTMQKEVVPALYDNIEIVGNLLRLNNKGATYGYIDHNGAFAITPQYEMAWEFKNGKAIVQQKEKYFYIDKRGKVIGDVPLQYQPYYYSNANTIYAIRENGKFGFSAPEKDGLVIPASYDFATDFEGKTARVNMGATLNEELWAYEGGKWGLINSAGTVIVPPTYELILPFSENLSLVNSGGEATFGLCEGDCLESVYYSCKGGTWGLINHGGKLISEPAYSSLIPFGKNFLASADSTYSIINGSGELIYPSQLGLNITMEEEGSIVTYSALKFIKATENRKTGVMANNGKWIVEPLYDDVLITTNAISTPFIHGLLPIRSGGLWGAINESGAVVITPEFDEMRAFSGKYAAVRKGDRWGFIDVNNQIVIQPQYFSVRDFQGEVVIVQPEKESPEGVVNNRGDVIVKPTAGVTFDYNGFVHGLCIINGQVQNETAGYPVATTGVIDSKGKILFHKSALTEARIYEGGLIYALKNNKWAVANADGAMLTGYNYDWIEPYVGQELIRCNIGGEVVYEEFGDGEEAYGGRWGLIDKTGKIRVPLKYNELGAFKDGLAPARTAEDLDEIGYVDFSGKTIRELKR